MKHVIVLGDVNVDMVISLPDRSAKRHDLSQSAPQLFGGGTGGNVAAGLSRLDVDVMMVGTIGDDSYGRWSQNDLKNAGVDITGVVTKRDVFTPMVIAMVEPDGERMLVVYPPHGGAHFKLEESDVQSKWLDNASWLHTTGMCLRESPTNETILSIMEQAHTRKIPVSFDINARLELWSMDEAMRRIFDRAIELSDVIFGSADEEIIPLSGASTLEDAGRKFSAGKRIVIARQGASGAVAFTPDETFNTPAFTLKVVDTIGAGDAFNSAFIAARVAGHDLREALRWGNAFAGLQIQGSGARSFPPLSEFQALLKSN